MRKLIILLMSISFFACEKEEIQMPDVPAQEIELRGKGLPPVTPGTVQANVNSLNLCGDGCLFDVDAITNTSVWSVGNPDAPGYIDYELEEAFDCAVCFSGCTVRPACPPESEPTIEFLLVDNGYTVFDPYLGDVVVYDYLSSSISPSTAEEIKEHFACEIRNFQDTYYSGYFSYASNIDFMGDALLCTCPSGQSRFLRANVTFRLHPTSCSKIQFFPS